ncbi:MAG: hypothetical protein ACK55K_04990 [Bacteroidota bacterium]
MIQKSKSKDIRGLIESNIIKTFNLQMDEVLSLCDSEIEAIMILHLFNYFLTYKREGLWHNRYKMEFIEDEIFLGEPEVSLDEELKYTNRIKKYNYRRDGAAYLKKIGFEIDDSEGEWIAVKDLDKIDVEKDLHFRKFEVRPQYLVDIEGSQYRIDIAIILNRFNRAGNLIDSRKIALECDGYDYHSSPEQKRNDDIRTRKLKKNGWREVFRYSGKELHGIKGTKEVHKLFEDIIEMLYL